MTSKKDLYLIALALLCNANLGGLTCRESLFSEAFGNEQGSKNRLLNILMNLRKCVDHPYLFDGEISEP